MHTQTPHEHYDYTMHIINQMELPWIGMSSLSDV